MQGMSSNSARAALTSLLCLPAAKLMCMVAAYGKQFTEPATEYSLLLQMSAQFQGWHRISHA